MRSTSMARCVVKGLVVLAVGLSACAEPDDDTSEVDLAARGESFAALYDEVFAAHDCTGCHDADAPGQLSLATPEDAYAQLVGIAASGRACGPGGELRVLAGDADASLLIHKLEGHDDGGDPVCGKPMPQETLLSAEQIARVRAWIDQGALQN